MSSQNFFNKGQNDANSAKGAATTSGLSYHDRQAYDAGYQRQQQQNQSGKKTDEPWRPGGHRRAARVAVKVWEQAMSGLMDRIEGREADVARVESPFDGEPVTRFIRAANGGLGGIVIEPVVLTPLRAKCATFTGLASIFGTMAAALAIAYATGAEWYVWYLAIALPGMLGVPMRALCRRVFRKRCRLVFTPEHFAVEAGAARAVLYDRQEAHRFRLEARHRKARKEAERHQRIAMRAQMNRRVANPEKYQTDCLHLMLDYRGQPRKLMEIMGQEEALLVLARVKLVDEVMERLVAMGHATTKGAQAEWDDMPGKIPEKV